MTRAIGIAADLDVAGALAGGPRAVEELARELDADPDTLQRLLRALASDGVFAQDRSGAFRNTETSELLRDPSRRAFAHLFGGPWHRAAAELEPRTTAAAFPQVFGTDFWAWLADNPDARAAFDTAMVDGTESRVERLGSVEWGGDETVVDVGGGNGALLVRFLRDRPGLRGIVFDLPETVRDEAALGDRIEFVAGSFFESVPEGDAYVLSGILHDWPDEDAARILRTIRATAPGHARLLINESVIRPGNDADGAKWLDLLMLVLAGGRERTEEEWRSLLEAAGWEPVLPRRRSDRGAGALVQAHEHRREQQQHENTHALHGRRTPPAQCRRRGEERQPEQHEDPHRRLAPRVALETRCVVGIACVKPRSHEQRRRRRDQGGRATVAIDDDRAREHRNESDEADDPFPVR
jgi:hypothetical protein